MNRHPSWRKTFISAIAIVVVGASAYLILTHDPIALLLGQHPGPFRRKLMTAVVEQVRLMELPPGQDHYLRLDDFSKPQTLRARQPEEYSGRCQGTGNVWARVTSDGQLTVVIETNDQGHSGEYGFAYSDVPLTSKPFGEGAWHTIDVPGHLQWVKPGM